MNSESKKKYKSCLNKILVSIWQMVSGILLNLLEEDN